MSQNGHPALARPRALLTPHTHYVPEGWEALDVGACPCGELVQWEEDNDHGQWVVDRSLVMFVLTEAQALEIREKALMIEKLEPVLDLQLALNRWPEEG